MKFKRYFPSFFIISLSIFLTLQGCKKDDNNESFSPAAITVNLSHNVDGQPLVLDEWNYTNPFGRTFKVSRLKYYLSDFRFNKSDGTSYKADMYHFVKASDSTTLQFTIDDVPGGEYESISFIFGLDEQKNVDGALPGSLDNLSMIWPAQLGGGYHYMQMEGYYKGASAIDSAFNTHMGLRKIDSTTFEQNYININLANSAITVNGKNWTVNIAMNINEWYRNPNNYDFPLYGQGIMDNPTAQQTIHENGATAFSLQDMSQN